MKILLVSQYFYPEEFKINELAETLVSKGHDVTVLTGKPNYPTGEYYDGYSFKGVMYEEYKGAKVIRVPLIKRRKGRAINLVLNYLSFVYYANKYISKHEIKADAIICFEISPITQAFPCIKCQKHYGGKILLWVQDLWPESVTAAGGIKNIFALSILNKMVKRIYDKCDVLMVQSLAFRDSILAKGDFKNKIQYMPNWADSIFTNDGNIDLNKYKSLMPEGFKVMFAGNIGFAQDFDAIIKAAVLTKDTPEIKYVIVGDGRARENAERQVSELGLEKSFVFLGRYPVVEMPNMFVHADVMLVSLKNDHIFSLTIPSKIQCYMASGKPIVTMIDGIGNEIVKDANCGITANAGDYRKLAENIKLMYLKTRENLKMMGDNAASYYKSHFDKDTVIESMLKTIETL